ncbi:hypothetical protein QL285_087229 [Trifolium repens]|nr:hypothetical protein QL285_087229 [Trifolium repens]
MNYYSQFPREINVTHFENTIVLIGPPNKHTKHNTTRFHLSLDLTRTSSEDREYRSGSKWTQIAKRRRRRRRRRRMVLNSGVVMRVAHVSARLCQYIACNPERLSSDAVLGLIFCLPFQRFIFSLSSYLGYSTPHSD